jgi:hypothetical protein
MSFGGALPTSIKNYPHLRYEAKTIDRYRQIRNRGHMPPLHTVLPNGVKVAV